LKSVTEYKEPVISMTDYNQGGYEVTASSENDVTTNMAWQIFDNLRTGTPNKWDDVWASSGTSYDSGNSYNANTVRQLATNTEYGEWVKLKLPDRRKLVAYKLSRQDYHVYESAPRKFRLYGSNDDSTWTEIAGSAVTRGATDPINSYSATVISNNDSTNADATSGSRFDLSTVSPAYQYFALVIEQTHAYHLTGFAEFELFCQSSEIDEFKLYASVDDSIWTEILHETSVPAITSAGTNFQLLPYKFGSDLPANFGFGSDLPANFGQLKNTDFFDIHYWCVYPSDNTIIIAVDANNDYLLFCRITQEGVDVAESSGFISNFDRPWVGNILSQEDLLSYYGTAEMNHLVGKTSSTFTKGSGFDGINVVNTYQYYGLVITKTKGHHNVSIGEMKIGNESKIAINY